MRVDGRWQHNAAGFFGAMKQVRYEDRRALSLAYRFYDEDEVVAGRTSAPLLGRSNEGVHVSFKGVPHGVAAFSPDKSARESCNQTESSGVSASAPPPRPSSPRAAERHPDGCCCSALSNGRSSEPCTPDAGSPVRLAGLR